MNFLKLTLLLQIAFFGLTINLKAQSEGDIEKEDKLTSQFTYSFQAGALFNDAVVEGEGIDLTLIGYSIRSTIGYQLNPKISVGFIAGFDEYPTTVLIPVGLFADATVGNSDIRWYNRVNSGYAFVTSNVKLNEGGHFINLETGLWIKTTQKSNITITIGHYRQRASQILRDVYYYPGLGDLHQEYSFRRVAFNIGYRTRI